ncbi:MAG: type II toxin-antitoxin system VapC family toxin [Pseudomonadota bacterium]
MRYLLDSNALLWALFDHSCLSARAAKTINDSANTIFASAVSAYELEWKKAIGKLAMPAVGDWRQAFGVAGYHHLPISVDHGQSAARLPQHHKDPWDRLIIAQAQVEALTIISNDRKFPAYGVATLW